MKRLCSILTLLLIASLTLFAQLPTGGTPAGGNGQVNPVLVSRLLPYLPKDANGQVIPQDPNSALYLIYQAYLTAVNGNIPTERCSETLTYRVLFVVPNADGTNTTFESATYTEEELSSIQFPQQSPTKESDLEYNYTFTSWVGPQADMQTMTVTYTATFASTRRPYTVKFTNGFSNGVLSQQTLYYGDQISYNGAQPTRPSTENNAYVFNGWQPELDVNTVVDGSNDEVTFTAQWITKYFVSFYVNDVLVNKEAHELGETPAYSPTARNIPANYRFEAWQPEIHEVEGNDTYTAQLVRIYTYSFLDISGQQIAQKADVDEGTDPSEVFAELNTAYPTKESTQSEVFEFVDWNESTASTQTTKVYVPNFENSVRQYTITFLEENCEDTIASLRLDYDALIMESSEMPENPEKTLYNFDGWKLEDSRNTYLENSTKVTGDATYCASFSFLQEYSVRFYADNWTNVKVYAWHTSGVDNNYNELVDDEPFGTFYNCPFISRVQGENYYEVSIKSGYNLLFAEYDDYAQRARGNGYFQTVDIRNIISDTCFALSNDMTVGDLRYNVDRIAECQAPVYKVVGSRVANWNPSEQNSIMTFKEADATHASNSYVDTLRNVFLAVQPDNNSLFEFKVVKVPFDGSEIKWYPESPSNVRVEVPSDGFYDIIITIEIDINDIKHVNYTLVPVGTH